MARLGIWHAQGSSEGTQHILFALLADTVPVLVIVADFSGCDCAETREEDERQSLNPTLKLLS